MAGGVGRRFGSAKQFVTLGGQLVVQRAVQTALDSCDGVVVVLPGDAAWDGPGAVSVTTGGATRSESVRRGLARVPADAGIVVVHDAARPLASAELFAAVIAAVRAGADAAVPGLAVADTLKRVEAGVVVATVERGGLVAVQTPQAFRAAILRAAHGAGGQASDDAGLVEAAGGRVAVVPGEATNFKLTAPGDVALARAVLAGGDDR